MKTRLGSIIVAVLAVLGAIAGFLGSSAYQAFQGASAGMRSQCQMLRVAETAGILTSEQRSAIARVVQPANDDQSTKYMLAYLNSDCSKTMMQFGIDQAKR